MLQTDLQHAQLLVANFRQGAPQSRRILREWIEQADLCSVCGFIGSLLQDADANVREVVAEGLGERSDPDATNLLRETAASDASEDVRTAAIRGLEARAAPEVLDCLVAEVSRPKQSRTPLQVVARLLGEYDDDKAVDALVELIDDDDVYVQQPAIESLFRLNRPRLEALWTRIAKSWEGTEWGQIAQRAMEELRERTARDEAASQAIVDGRTSTALKDFNSSDPVVRKSAIRRLIFYRPSYAIDLLLVALGDSDERVRAAAASALGALGDERARAPILQMMREEGSEPAYAAAVQVLAAFPSKDVFLTLKETLRGRFSSSPDVLSGVAIALGNYDDEETVDALIGLLQIRSPLVRNTAADVLLRLNRPRLRETWLMLASEEGPLGRTAQEAIRALDQQDGRS